MSRPGVFEAPEGQVGTVFTNIKDPQFSWRVHDDNSIHFYVDGMYKTLSGWTWEALVKARATIHRSDKPPADYRMPEGL